MKEMVGGCCVCSDDRGWSENPLVYCDGQSCTVAVHQACYGIVTVPTGPWYCRKCESQERAVKVKCELCPSKYGALKRTDNGGWAHVVCALYIPEVRFGNVTTMEPIQLQLIPQERFNKVCYICEEGGKASNAGVGACMQCNKSGCKQQFHVTCAQGLGLLCEEAGNYLDNVKYCGYCQHHYSKLKKGINIKTIPPYKPHQSDSSSEKETDNSGANSGSTANQSAGASSTTATTSSSANSGNTANTGSSATVLASSALTSTATTGKRKYYSNSKAKIEKSTANSTQQQQSSATTISSSSSNTPASKTYQKKSSTATTSSTSSTSSSSTKNNNNNSQTNNTQTKTSLNSVVSGIKEEALKVEVKVEVKKEVEDAVVAATVAAAAAQAIAAVPIKGKKRKANSRTPTPNTVGTVSDSVSVVNSDSVVETKKENVEAKKTKQIDIPIATLTTAPTLTTSSVPTTTAIPTALVPSITRATPTPLSTITTTTTAQLTTAPTTITPSTTVPYSITIPTTAVLQQPIQPTLTTTPIISSPSVNSLVVSVPLLPLVPSSSTTSAISPRPIISTVVASNTQQVAQTFSEANSSRLTPTPFSLGVESRQHHPGQQQMLSGSLDLNGIPVSQSGLLLEQDAMLTSEFTGGGGLKIMFEKQPPPSIAVQAEIDRNTPTADVPMKRSRSQSMEKNDKVMRSSKKRSSNGLSGTSINALPSSSRASPVAGCSAATPPPSVVSTITKRASRSQHPTPPPMMGGQYVGQQSGGMLGISLSSTSQIKDSPPSSPSSESLGAPPVTVGRKKGRKSAPASVSSSSSSHTVKDSKDIKDIKLFQNGVHAPHMLGNQLNPNSNMAQKMSDHLNSELEAHSIFNTTESSATLVGPQLHNRVLASARSSSTGGSSTASAGSGLSSMLGGGSGAIPQTLDQLLERQWEQGSQFLMEQAQHFDIASLLSCLHQLRAENTRLEEHVSSLLQRRDHLLAVNARLAIPLTGPPATPQSSHPHTVNNIHPSVVSNHSEMTSRSSRHSSGNAGSSGAGYSHSGAGPLENGLPAEAVFVQQHSHRSAAPQQGQQTQPSPTIRHSSSNYASGAGNVSGLLRTAESSSGGGGSGGRSSSSSRSHQQQHYMYQPTTQQQQMSMRREAELHHQSSSKPS